MPSMNSPSTPERKGGGGSGRDVRVYPDPDALSAGVAEEISRLAEAAVREKGRFDWVLSGGRTPRRLYELIARDYRDRMPWPQVHLFWGDERFVTAEDARSNYRMVREALIDRLALPEANVHAISTGYARPDEAARVYEEQLRAYFAGGDPAFDLVLLGLGPEGHTASLFPDSEALAERERWAVAVSVSAEPPERITLTLPALNRARNVFFLVVGKDKQEIIRSLFSGPQHSRSPYPAGLIEPAGRVVWFLDRGAHG